MADIDGWHARDLMTPLFFNDNTDVIRKRLLLPYLTGSFYFLKSMQADFLWLYRNRMEAFAPSLRRDLASLFRKSSS